MTRDWRSLKSPDTFLACGFSAPVDSALICQVNLWTLNRNAFECFGADVESTIVQQRIHELLNLNKAYDEWHSDQTPTLSSRSKSDPFPQYLSDLYYYSGKLYLLSHIFRGPSIPESSAARSDTAGMMIEEAFEAALSVVRCVAEPANDLCASLARLPSYFHTMIAFASVCLIRISLHKQLVDQAKLEAALILLQQLPPVLRASCSSVAPDHLLLSIADSVERTINEWNRTNGGQVTPSNNDILPDFNLSFDAFDNDVFNWSFLGDEYSWSLCPDETNT